MSIIKRGATGLQTVAVADIKTGGGTPDPSLATVIALSQQWNVVIAEIPSIVTTTNGLAGIKLPPDADTELCDVVEIYAKASATGGTLLVYDDSNNLIAGIAGGSGGAAIVLRKIDAATWRTLSAT